MKNKHAVLLGKKRWKNKTKKDIHAHMSMMGKTSQMKKSLSTGIPLTITTASDNI